MKRIACSVILLSMVTYGTLQVAAKPERQKFPSLGIATPTKSVGQATATPSATSSATPVPVATPDSKQKDEPVIFETSEPSIVKKRFVSREITAAESKAYSNTRRNTQDITDAMANQADFVYTYINNGIYRIYCKEQRLTDIQLQTGETILFIGAGDTVRWQVDTDVSGDGEAQQAHVYVKPLRSGIKTNLIINTNRHNYHCEIISGNTYSPIICWAYPKEKRMAFFQREQTDKQMEVTGTLDYASMNFNYKISGKNYPWKPQMVFSDQSHVYIQMGASMQSDEAPALFIKEGKKLQLVNYRVRNGYYIVDRLFQEAEMRCGKKKISIKQTKANNDK